MVFFKFLCYATLAVISSCMPLNNEPSQEVLVVTDVKVSEIPQARNTLNPGLSITSYAVELEPNFDTGRFEGTVVVVGTYTNMDNRDDDITFHISDDLSVSAVEAASGGSFNGIGFEIDDGELIIPLETSTLNLRIRFNGNLNPSTGLYMGSDGNSHYLAMNLHPTNARQVFPCIDELTETSRITFTVNGVSYANLISNTLPVDNDPNTFRTMSGPPSRWGILGHDFEIYTSATLRVPFYGRSGGRGQDGTASAAINSVFNFINEWTDKDYFTIDEINQAANLHVVAFPDIDTEWNALSIVGVWEAYALMENNQNSVKQRQIGFVKIAEGLARPWFGFTLYPLNWVFEWVNTGLSTYVAYEALKEFQADANGLLLDYETLFVTEVLQESLYRDAYASARVLEPDNYIYDEEQIRLHSRGLMKYKAPAIMYWLAKSAHREIDVVQRGARSLFSNSLEAFHSQHFIDNMDQTWPAGSLISDLDDFLRPYIKNRGYPILTVIYENRQVIVSRGVFSFDSTDRSVDFHIPLSFTTSVNTNFDDVFPSINFDGSNSISFTVNLEDEDWILFNIQGRGYYRVQYNLDMWERIIEALEDPDRRKEIHPLNRATLVDDSLNIARRLVAGLSYDIAFRIALAMEHETEYAPWRAYIRNFNFINKRLEAMIWDDEDLDPDIYLRMVRRTIGAFEDQIGFRNAPANNEPEMTSLTRGMVMDYACRAGYDPCIAAAVDWFYSGNDVNPDIPHDIKPAVYCSVVREGDGAVRDLLLTLLDNTIRTRNMYERLVILEALACSQDGNFINSYLQDTIRVDSPYSVAERSRIFAAVAGSSYSNAGRALNFLRQNIVTIRNQYGGLAKLEEMIFVMAENCVDGDLYGDLEAWIQNTNNNLGDSEDAAIEALAMAKENMDWSDRYLQEVYEWIDENDATTTMISLMLLSFMTLLVHLLN